MPNGIPGIETRLPILFSEGVSKGRITPERFVALTATNPARIYGLYRSIMVGADADIVLWDPEMTAPIRQRELHHGPDYTPYEGMTITGWPVRTILRGKMMAKDRKVTGKTGDGAYVTRGHSEFV